MQQFESEHYIFNYHEGSLAEKELPIIVAQQEACFAYVCKTLNVTPDFKIEYTLGNTPEEVGELSGENDSKPCNGFAKMPNQICAVYNEKIKCIGMHEDSHIISYYVGIPESAAIREGLAMFFDRKWWGISNHDWTLYYLNSGQYMPVNKMIENDDFYECDCALTYPIMGAFTEYLILSYGSEKYMSLYRHIDYRSYTGDTKTAYQQTYGKSLYELNEEFVQYTKLFSMDARIVERIAELLAK